MPLLKFARERPSSSTAVRADLRRAAEYRAGRRLSDDEVRRLLDAEWDALVKRWVALGQWIATLEAYDAVGEVPRRRRMAGCRHDGVWRAKQASAARAHWARVKAIATDGCQERQAT